MQTAASGTTVAFHEEHLPNEQGRLKTSHSRVAKNDSAAELSKPEDDDVADVLGAATDTTAILIGSQASSALGSFEVAGGEQPA